MLGRIAALLGPIFAKEIVETARRRRYYLTRALYGSVLLFVLFLVWQENSGRLRYAGPNSINAMARVAEELSRAVSWVQYGAVFLFVPLFLCGVIAGEREERTLELLFTTQLTDREIVLGKLASRVAMLVLLILCGLPVMSLIMLFGGIDPESLWRVLAATLLAILYAGSHAIYFSAITRSPLGALVRTYWWMALWLVGVPLAVGLVLEAISGGRGTVELVVGGLLFINPVGAFIIGMETLAYNRMAAFLGLWFYPFTFVLPAAWSLLLIWRAVRRLRVEPIPFAQWVKRFSPQRPLSEELKREVADWERQRRARGQRTWLGHVVQNPLWLRARRARVYDREGHIGRVQWAAWAVALFFLGLMALVDAKEIGHEEVSMAFLAPTWVGVAALAAVVAGTSLVGDRRRGFLELVLTTPLAGCEILDGTFRAVGEHLRRICWLPWALGGFFILVGASLFFGVLFSLLTGTLFCALIVLYGIGFSLAARTLPGALVPAILFPLLVVGGMPFLMAIFEDDHGPILWVLCAVFLMGSWYWVHGHLNAGSVFCYLTAVHLAIVALAACWTYDGRRDEYPIAAMNAGFLTIVTLDDHSHRWFGENGRYWYNVLPCYWAALAVNLVWARWWLIRHFDRLAERTHRPVRLHAGYAGVPFGSTNGDRGRSGPVVQTGARDSPAPISLAPDPTSRER